MLIAFDSRTGNVGRFIEKCGLRAVKIDADTVLSEPFVIVTYVTGFGKVPDKTEKFLRNNHALLSGVSSSGNRNWGDAFAVSADRISEGYGVPVVSKFELSGTKDDVQNFIEGVHKIDELYRAQQPADAKGA